MKISIIGAYPPSLLTFRKELIKAFKEKGCLVTSMSSKPSSDELSEILKISDKHVDYSISRNGLNPLGDFKTLLDLFRAFKVTQPDLILAYTIKPIIWGGIASRFIKKPSFFALVTGLGFAFQSGGKLKNILVFLVKNLYRFALKNSKAVIFQNPDNMKVFVEQGIVPENKCYLVNGSGVDLEHYSAEPLPSKPVFLLVARLLGDKGIREYAAASEVVKRKYPNAVFNLVGPEDPSPDGIELSEIMHFHEQGYLHYYGEAKDVRPFIKECSIFVLPSYHEGMPRTVLEAMAMRRPILTTDVPGCRETVLNGKNGWLIPKTDVQALADKMIWFIENQSQWCRMSEASYELAKNKFDVHKVNKELLKIMAIE